MLQERLLLAPLAAPRLGQHAPQDRKGAAFVAQGDPQHGKTFAQVGSVHHQLDLAPVGLGQETAGKALIPLHRRNGGILQEAFQPLLGVAQCAGNGQILSNRGQLHVHSRKQTQDKQRDVAQLRLAGFT